jgi:hypothetical protein
MVFGLFPGTAFFRDGLFQGRTEFPLTSIERTRLLVDKTKCQRSLADVKGNSVRPRKKLCSPGSGLGSESHRTICLFWGFVAKTVQANSVTSWTVVDPKTETVVDPKVRHGEREKIGDIYRP